MLESTVYQRMPSTKTVFSWHLKYARTRATDVGIRQSCNYSIPGMPENGQVEPTRVTNAYGTMNTVIMLVNAPRAPRGDIGWFKHKTPNSFRCQRPRRFWELDPEILHVFSAPLPSLERMEVFCFLFFSSDIWVCVFFWDIWVSRDPTFSAEKTHTHTHTHILGKGSARAH